MDRPAYEVRKILRRGTDQFLAYFSTEMGRPLVKSENPRIAPPFKVAGDWRNACEQDKVIAKFVRWDPPARIPTCKIIRVLGPGNDARTDHKGILAKYGLSSSFSSGATKEAQACPRVVSQEERKGRKDMRKVFTLTIDPLDARDFDDALSIRLLAQGGVEVGVHVADVSHYVKPGSSLDGEARRRGNSTYLVGEVIPMLPTSLSNGICSLVEGEDRLVKSVIFRFSKEFKLLGQEFSESVICSDKRLTYEQALVFLTKDSFSEALSCAPVHRHSGNPGRSLQELEEVELKTIAESIRLLGRIASTLRIKRIKDGALELASSEVKVLVDEMGQPEKIFLNQDDDSHRLIEEFMLLANESVARLARKRNLDVVYRVHPDPDPENLEELRQFLALFGISCGELNSRKAVNKALEQINRHPISQVLRIRFLRSLQQACYRPAPDGHYGLAKKDYLHFTSPIRRYADLIAHRALEGHLRSHKPKKNKSEVMASLAKRLSISERNSVDAERESIKDKMILYYKRDLESNRAVKHKALITEISRKGFFIELTDTLFRGFVTMRSLPREVGYRLAGNGSMLVGKNPKNKLRLGQEIEVCVERIPPLEKLVDFRLA